MKHPTDETTPLNPSLNKPQSGTPLAPDFFDRDPQVVACDLIGKVLCHRIVTDGAAPTGKEPDARALDSGMWLKAMIVETEAYYQADKASHASLGYTEKRKALFMPPGTVYMYYARGGDSFNLSCAGSGNAVLVKAGIPHDGCRDDVPDEDLDPNPSPMGKATFSPIVSTGISTMIAMMHRLNPTASGGMRPTHRLCSGQTLLCRSLGLRVPEWDRQPVAHPRLRIIDVGHRPSKVIRTTRLGIPEGRDGHLPYRFVHGEHLASATRNPLPRGRVQNRDHQSLTQVLTPRPAPQTTSWEAMLDFPHATESS